MLRRRGYIGRQLRPSQLAKELMDPAEQLWCATCHMAVQRNNWVGHKQSRNHVLASIKIKKMKQLSLDMWIRHRAAPLHQESSFEESIEREFERFRAEQREREKK